MVALRLIPCLDVADGRVVKGVNFVAFAMQEIPLNSLAATARQALMNGVS